MRTNKQQLDKILPLGLLATRQYVLSHGIDRHRFDNAVKSRHIVAISHGVYVREGVPLSWQGVMSSLPLLFRELPFYIGGVSAIELLGLGHYVQQLSTLNIYSATQKPNWLSQLDLSVDFNFHSTRRLWENLLFDDSKILNQHSWREDLPPYLVASAEQACLEFLVAVPNTISFEYADSLFQNISTLSPRRLDTLLKLCKSVKAKRLFFWFAKRHGFQWSKKINPSDYDLGKGKRVIAKQGYLDKELLITVPDTL
ncbi:MAG: type IV toxin-antitoxin system AbiEi family antitoxin [Proteobacteria bacterium]|nr:type IV toxin-antitoxin system AbiEi family antitoxin [Pseudomonadota bacterium]